MTLSIYLSNYCKVVPGVRYETGRRGFIRLFKDNGKPYIWELKKENPKGFLHLPERRADKESLGFSSNRLKSRTAGQARKRPA